MNFGKGHSDRNTGHGCVFLKPGLAFMENWGGEMYIPPQSVQNLEILITSSILGVECSDFVKILDIIFLKFELNFEMLTWTFPKSQNSKLKKYQ
mgnify:CR=1 FL=1